MSVDKAEVVSDVEPLPESSPPSPPLLSLSSSSFPPLLSLSSSCLPSLARSWPSSPLSSSRQVTAHLYSSLQRSKEQELTHTYTSLNPLSSTEHSNKHRQVSFKSLSPELRSTAAHSLSSDRLSESQQLELSLGVASGMEEAESEAELLTEEMDLKLQSSVNNSAKLTSGRRHIEEMENVRSHLQTILRSAPTATDTDDLLRPVSHHLQDDSYESDTTSHLLSAALSLGGVEELFPRYSRLHGDVNSAPLPSLSELQVIRESLERERGRRKHSEQQVLILQNKALALQQQLALAVSADRKKDIMIEQLDKTLEKVVEGWRGYEREKSEGVRRLQEEKEAAECARNKHRQTLVCFEKSLSEAAETLNKEQKRNEELQNTNKQQARELAELRVCVEELRVCAEQRRCEAEEERSKAENLQKLTHTLQTQLEQQQQQNTHTLTQLQQEITHLTQQLEREKERVGLEAQLREEAQSSVNQLQQDLEQTRRERDAARVDRALDQARFDAQRSQWEVELRLSVEQQLTERLANIQQENATATAKLREQHRKQLLDLSGHHERERSAQMEEFTAQLQEKEEKQQQLSLHYNNKIAVLQEELVSVETCKRRLEVQREELVSRLQGMMRSHWTEALRLLTNQEQAEGIFSPLSVWDGCKPHSSPQDPDSSIYSTTTSLTPAAPQAVVLHLSRERERGMRGEREMKVERGRGESDFSLLSHSHAFCPLEPELDDTHLTAVGGSDFWDRPVGGEKQQLERVRGERGREGERVREGDRAKEERARERVREGERVREEERVREGERGREGERDGLERRVEGLEEGFTPRSHAESLIQKTSQFELQDSYFDSTRIRNQFDQCLNRQVIQNQNQSITLNQEHAPSERRTNQSYRSGRADIPVEKYSSAGTKAPPMKEQALSVKERAPPTVSCLSSLGGDRQNELQYYITKLLDCPPGEPVQDSSADQTTLETHTSESGVMSRWESSSSGPKAVLNSLLTHTPALQKPVHTLSSSSHTHTHTHTGAQAAHTDPQLEQLAELLRLALPQTQNQQNLQQILNNIIRPEEPCTDPVRTNQDLRLTQPDRRERQAPPRSAPNTTSRGRRPPTQRSGSKVNAWR